MPDDNKPKNFTIAAAPPKKVGGITIPSKEIIETPPEKLDDLERQLQESLRIIQERKLKIAADEIARKQDEFNTRPITLHVIELSGARVIMQIEERLDLHDLLKSYDDILFRRDRVNIPIKIWESVASAIATLPFVSLVYDEGIEAAIDFHMNAPVWYVQLEPRVLKLTPGPGYVAYDIVNIPGNVWNSEKKYFTVPKSEAFRAYEALANTQGVLYTDEARDFILDQVKRRADIDAIGKAEDWTFDVELSNGNTLRGYQRVGCAFADAAGGRALLAYEMGLGKTPMSIAYAIKNNLRTIVVCPASLKANWCRQIYKFTNQQANVMMGAEPTNHDIATLIVNPTQFTVINFDIVGRKIEYDDKTVDADGYTHVAHKERFLWVEALNMSKPDLIIVDESHYIKNTDSNRSQGVRLLKSPRLLHMTGTPVLNRPGEMWAILNHLAPETFPSEQTFISQYTYDGKRAANVEQLKEALKSVMIRRKQSDVRKDLPPRNRVVEYHDLSKKALKVYKKVLQGVYERIEAYSARGHGGEDTVANILVQIQRLKQVCSIDKTTRTAELAVELHESAIEERHNKVLIFSQFKACAYSIAQKLGPEALSFVSIGKNDFITASNDTRDKLVQQFQNDPKIKYLVVTEKTAKEGHDCTEAGFVIFNDLFWTPANHEQGEGRAYMREVDPHDISSYYLITDKESGADIEEWIWDLLKMKTSVIEATVEGVESARSDTGVAMELINLMKESMWSRKKR